MSGLSITVLGCSGTRPGPLRLCSSYLLHYAGYRLLLDCGNGSLSNLQRCCDIADIDAIVISHLHPDHFADLYGLYYGLRFHPTGHQSVPVYAPEGASSFASQLLDSADVFAETCRFTTVAAGTRLELGPFTVGLFAANHPIETLASRVHVGGRVIAYSADSAPTPALIECARDADLFIADCTWTESQRPLPANVHMTGREAGQHAKTAGVARLLVTHVFPTNDPAVVAAEVAQEFDGEILIAEDLQVIDL